MNTHDHARELFYNATLLLIGARDIRERVIGSAMAFSHVRESEVPPDLLNTLKELRADVARVPGPDGSITATVNSLNDDEAEALGHRIFDFYIALRGGI